MKWLGILLHVLVRALLPVLIEQSRDKAEDATPDPELKKRLHERIRRTWGSAMLFFVVIFIAGCGVRTVYVPAGEPVRLRKTIHDAPVWVKDGGGQPVEGVMDLYEGWYALELRPKDE